MAENIKEVWRVVVTPREGIYEDYLISSQGRVKSLKRGKERIMKPLIDNENYLVVFLYKDGKARKYRIHQLMGYCFIPNVMGYPEIDHRDIDRQRNVLSNLTWVTHQQNMQNPLTRKKISNSKRRKYNV